MRATTLFSVLGAATLGIAAAVSIAAAAQGAKRNASAASDQVVVPGSSFVMGANDGAKDEAPAHRVTVNAFSIDRHEITNDRYASCVRAGKCEAPKLRGSQQRTSYYDNREYANHPVIFVSHDQASAYCAFAGGRLPTEAEWELAARGNDGRRYPWGNAEPSCSHANFGGPSEKNGCLGDTDRVGARPMGASPFGVLDMAGNVWEWTADRYDATYYARSPEVDPKGSDDGRLRVMRGGCWQSGASSLRSTCRKAELPGTWAPNVGFRCVYAAPKGGKQ